MMLVYFKGKGVWFDFPSVDSPKRNAAFKKWIAENLPATGDDSNGEEREKYSANLAEWNKNNPPPKYKVVEDEISLEKERFFDFSKPVLSYQPEEADVFALFKLKAKDERQLRYEGEVTVSTLLPCDHPDGDRSGFFFRLDAPQTFTHKDVFLDKPDKPANRETIESKVAPINSDLGYVDVFFKGYGCWTSDIYLIEESSGEPTIHIPIGKQVNESSVCGVFALGIDDRIAYKHSKSLDGVCTLLPCTTHSNRVSTPEIDWSRIQNIGTLGVDLFVDVYFSIDRKRPERPIIAKPDNPTNSLTIENDGAISQEATEPESAKVIQPNNNEFAFSGLLHIPSGVDDWFEVIDVMTKAFYDKNNVMPTKAKAWAELCTNTPIGYGISSDDNNLSLTMPGVIKLLNKRSFDRRWTKYTAKSNPFKPN